MIIELIRVSKNDVIPPAAGGKWPTIRTLGFILIILVSATLNTGSKDKLSHDGMAHKAEKIPVRAERG